MLKDIPDMIHPSVFGWYIIATCVWFQLSTTARALYLWIAPGQMRIVVSDEAIEFYSLGYSIIGGWQNIERIRKVRRERYLSTEAIIFKRCTCVGWKIWIWLAMGETVFSHAIPIGDFGRWRKQHLAQGLNDRMPSGVFLLPNSAKIQAIRSREEIITEQMEDFLGSLANPTKRRIPRRR